MRQLTSGALLDALRGVHWPARRMSRGTWLGGHRSRRVGAAPEFMEYRPYQQGDDASKIDWKLFGRTERVAIRLSHDDSSLRTSVLVDASASMAFPEDTLAKWETAAAVALGLCAVAHGDTDPVGLGIAAEATRHLPPRTRRGTITDVLRLLTDTIPSGAAPLAPVLAMLRGSRRIAVVSDFLGDAEAVLALVRQMLAAGTEVFAVHVVDPLELDPGPLDRVVTDPEDPSLRRPLGFPEREAYQDRYRRWREDLGERWRAAGAEYHQVTTDERPDRIVRRVVGSPQ